MSAALSLLDDDPFEPTFTPAGSAGSAGSTLAAVPEDHAHPHWDTSTPLDPGVLRDRATLARALKPGGISVPMLIVATAMSSPALIQGLVRHSIAFNVMLERWVVITLGCWAISEGVRRYVVATQRRAAPEAGEDVEGKDSTPES